MKIGLGRPAKQSNVEEHDAVVCQALEHGFNTFRL